MAPKSKQKHKSSSQAQQPKALSSRVRQVAATSTADEPTSTAAEEGEQHLIIPLQLAFTGLLGREWARSLTSTFVYVQNYASASPLWRDSFCVSVESSWLSPPLHKYLRRAEADSAHEQLVMQFWRESRFRERVQLGYQLIRQHGNVVDAAVLLYDLVPALGIKGWVRRIKLACAAFRCAFHQRTSDSLGVSGLADSGGLEGSLDPPDAQWLRAQWLLAKTLSGAINHTRRCVDAVLSLVVSAMVGCDPSDALGARFGLWKTLGNSCVWHSLLTTLDPTRGPQHHTTPPDKPPSRQGPNTSSTTPSTPSTPSTPTPTLAVDSHTMAAAYTRALACFNEYGAAHRHTAAAVTAALRCDPGKWVPLMLSGAVLAVPVMAPLMPLGGKEEASAYCAEFGLLWWVESLIEARAQGLSYCDRPLDTPQCITWLLRQAGLPDLCKPKLGKSLIPVLLFNTNMIVSAWGSVIGTVVDEMNVRINGSMAVGTARSADPRSCPKVLRAHLVLLCCLAQRSANLPPVDAGGFSLWEPVANMMSISNTESGQAAVKSRLRDTALLVYDIAQRLIQSCKQWQQQPESDVQAGGGDRSAAAAAAAGRQSQQQRQLGLAWWNEVSHFERTLAELEPARVRMCWQAGQLRQAKDLAADLIEQQQLLHASVLRTLSSSSGSNGSSGSSDVHRHRALATLLTGSPDAPGPVLFSLSALKDMSHFLNQQGIETARHSLKGPRGGSSSSGSSSSSSREKVPGEVQYPRYDVCTPDRIEEEFVQEIYEAAGGQELLDAALAPLYGSSSNGGCKGSSESDEEEEDEDEYDGHCEGCECGAEARRMKRANEAMGILTTLLTGGAAASSSQTEQADTKPPPQQQRQRLQQHREQNAAAALVSSALQTHAQCTGSQVGGGGRQGSSSSRGSIDPDGWDQLSQMLSNPWLMEAAVRLLKEESEAAAAAAAVPAVSPPVPAAGKDSSGGGGVGVSSSSKQQELLQTPPPPTMIFGAASGPPPQAPSAAGPGPTSTSAAPGPTSTAAAPGPASTAAAAAAAAPSPAPAAVSSSSQKKVCAFCGGHFPKLFKCSSCNAAGIYTGYCSATCQKAHWKSGHKQNCGLRAAAVL